MFLLPGRLVAVTLTDQTVLRATTRWSWRTLRLRDVAAFGPDGRQAGFTPNALVPPTAVLTVQIL